MMRGFASCVWMMSFTRSIGAVHVLAIAPEMPPPTGVVRRLADEL